MSKYFIKISEFNEDELIMMVLIFDEVEEINLKNRKIKRTYG